MSEGTLIVAPRKRDVDPMTIKLNILHYCAAEVERQQASPMAVLWMVHGWRFALDYADLIPDMATIRTIGSLVEPNLNANFRSVGIRAGSKVFPPANEVRPRLERLLESLPDITPNEFYYEFEEIHPFRDGNGRTGKILLNWLNKTLDEPVMPPNFWRISNP